MNVPLSAWAPIPPLQAGHGATFSSPPHGNGPYNTFGSVNSLVPQVAQVWAIT